MELRIQDARQAVWHTPELLCAILEYLPGRHLYQALHVNKHWAQVGCDVLWRSPPTIAFVHLRPVHNEDRTQTMADSVRRLDFNYHINPDVDPPQHVFHAMMKRLQFPRLQSASIHGGDDFKEITALLRDRCPNLRSISLTCVRSSMHDLKAFFDSCGSLREIFIDRATWYWFNDDASALSTLASLENLSKLEVDGPVSVTQVQHLLEEVDRPFRRLELLRITLRCDAVGLLLTVRPEAMLELELHVLHETGSTLSSCIVEPIKDLHTLRKLVIEYEESCEGHFTQASVAALNDFAVSLVRRQSLVRDANDPD